MSKAEQAEVVKLEWQDWLLVEEPRQSPISRKENWKNYRTFLTFSSSPRRLGFFFLSPIRYR